MEEKTSLKQIEKEMKKLGYKGESPEKVLDDAVSLECELAEISQLPATKVAGLHDSVGRCSPPRRRHTTYPDIARLTELPQKRCRGRPVRGRFPSELPC